MRNVIVPTMIAFRRPIASAKLPTQIFDEKAPEMKIEIRKVVILSNEKNYHLAAEAQR